DASLASCSIYLDRADWPGTPEDIFVQAAWWLGDRAFRPRSSETVRPAGGRLFADAGVAVLSHGRFHIVADVPAFGYGHAGHSHSHALQVVCRRHDRDVLIDPGTYTYVGEPEWRDRFRGAGFHNTIRIDRLDQAEPQGPFRWTSKPVSEILVWKSDDSTSYLH